MLIKTSDGWIQLDPGISEGDGDGFLPAAAGGPGNHFCQVPWQNPGSIVDLLVVVDEEGHVKEKREVHCPLGSI